MAAELKNSRLIYRACNALLVVSGLCVSLYLAWLVLSAVNFFYPVLHDVIGIQDTIEEYAPQNIYKNAFEETTREQRADLFRQIVHGINHDGAGLAAIRYSNATGQPLGNLLRPVEVTHLEDVAHLLNAFRKSAYIALAALIAVVLWFRVRHLNIPKPRYVVSGVALTVLVTLLLISLSGAKNIFYRLHTFVFPQGHQWFFYYEESLMTLLMKAPDIFAWLTALLLILAMIIFYLMLVLVRVLLDAGSS